MKPILATMLSVSSTVLTDGEKHLLEQANPMGITLFKRNVQDKEQVKALIESIKEVIGHPNVLIAVDQEGGRVRRFAEPNWPFYVSQYALGSLKGAAGNKLTCLHGTLIAHDLKEMGVNWNYAPVLDVAYSETTQALGNRIFSTNEREVANRGKILLEAYMGNGICPCVKHLPGHGRASVDPHLNLPVLSQSLKELEKDFYPFEAVGKIAPAGMTAHIVISAVDDKPITQSKKGIQEIIRGRIGFDGFLISDAIDMKALHGTLAEKTKASLDAGCDAICYCFGNEDELREVISAARPLSDKSMERFERICDVISKPIPSMDTGKMYCEYTTLASKTKNLGTDYDAVEILNRMKQKC